MTKPRTRAKPDYEIVRPAILAELKRQGLTPSWLAREIGMSPPNIYPILSGHKQPGLRAVDRMLRALGLRVTR